MEQKHLVSDQEILEKARELARMISESAEVDFYKRAEQQIKKNERVQALINRIKQKQKEAVALEHLQKTELLRKVEAEIEKLQEELESIPIVREFQQSQADVNDLLQMVSNVISNTVTDYIILSTGGNPLYGQTGGGAAKDAGPANGVG
ncbi:regulatory iron-sulfur-containing complex subunit RicA [Bacillaceae bacterium]